MQKNMRIVLFLLLQAILLSITTASKICGEHEEYTDCGTACPRTCQNRNDPPKICTKQCVKGCFCKDNYIRDTSTGKCVTEDQCPKAIKCGKNEEEVECENPCQPTCDDPNKLPCPTLVCNRGCHCKPGFLRDSSGKCIPKDDCPRPKCGCHEVYTDCGSYCPPTCQNQNPGPCILLCKPGCFCKKKYIRDELSGRCIKKEECP